ncbi:hypothetical protein [Streptomyces sp. RPT161]|uniref:hypothetical protein n=1 Tax=Streptomyces sp. RPT161 TaxID=3015993 RepID=UPI0022B86593|nr:hypothetical protein [Streptomyces sp. RPT161]
MRRVVADDEEWVAGLIEQGLLADRVMLPLGMFHASRRGEFAATSPTLENLLGRPATPLAEVVLPGAAS